jgi:hemerythrin superfamily protein
MSPAGDDVKSVLEMLSDDHRKLQRLFRDGDHVADDPDALRAIVERACDGLAQHAEIEEEFFYPALRGATGEELLEQAQVEHDVAKQLIADLRSMDADDERYHATFHVLAEYAVHHIEEEERRIFALARKAKADLEALHEALMARADADEEAAEKSAATGAAPSRARRAGNTRAHARPGSRSTHRSRQ